MARQNYWQDNFTTGEISPRAGAQTDLKKYSSGLAELTNFVIQLTGGVIKRSGTIFTKAVKDITALTWLMPFNIGENSAYVIEMGENYFRYYTEQGQLVDTGTPVETVTPYITADNPSVDYAQSADTLFLAHPAYPPQVLKRTSATSFAITPFDFQDGPYMDMNQVQTQLMIHSDFTRYQVKDPTTGVVSYRYNGSGTLTTSGFAGGIGPFVASDVGRWVRLRQGSVWGAVKITAFTDTNTVTGTALDILPLGDSGPTPHIVAVTANTPYDIADWRLGSWSDTTGYPSHVTFHQGRTCWANTPTEPQGFWASESNIFNLFSPTEDDLSVIDSDGFGYTIVSNKSNSVQWMLSAQALMVGTYNSEYAAITSQNGTPLTPSNIAFQQQTGFGSKPIRPFLIGVSTIFVQKSGQKVREQTYDWSINGWRATEISLLSEHLFREGGGIVQADYQQEPGDIWWGLRADGVIIGMTYVKEQNIVGFHKHIIGGSFNGGQAVVESIAVIPTPDGSQDQLWMIVKRTINGVTQRYVEYMDINFDASKNGKSSMNFVDCGVQNAGFPSPLGSPTDTFAGLDHLVGETVAICGNQSVQPSVVVADDGSIQLQSKVTLITAGLPFTARMQTLTLPVAGDFGTSQGTVRRIDRLIFRILDSLSFKAGEDFNSLLNMVFATTIDPMDNSPALFSGDKDIFFNGNLGDTLGQIAIQSDAPYPLTIIGMSPQLVVQPK